MNTTNKQELPDPLGCNKCTHPECGRFNGPRSVECRAMADNACAREVSAVRELPAPGDYVLATKYSDGDPGDAWALGFYVGPLGERFDVVDGKGERMRASGYRRIGKVSEELGRWLLANAKVLESSPPGALNLWSMIGFPTTDAAQPSEATKLLKEIYGFLSDIGPEGIADEAFRIVPDSVLPYSERTGLLPVHAQQGDSDGKRMGLAQQDSSSGRAADGALSEATSAPMAVEAMFDAFCAVNSSLDAEDMRNIIERILALASHAAPAVAVGEPVAWMTHHDEPMLFPTREETDRYCDVGEDPIPLYAHPSTAAPVQEQAKTRDVIIKDDLYRITFLDGGYAEVLLVQAGINQPRPGAGAGGKDAG